jgi:hypothetical protein
MSYYLTVLPARTASWFVLKYERLFLGWRVLVIWQEFGKDLSVNLENRLILFHFKWFENLIEQRRLEERSKHNGVCIGFDQNRRKRSALFL